MKDQFECPPLFQPLLKQCLEREPLSVAVVFPKTKDCLKGILWAKQLKLIKPIIFGDQELIRSLCEENNIDDRSIEIKNYSNIKDALHAALIAVKEKQCQCLMKGTLETSVLLKGAFDKKYELRTNNRISHCLVAGISTIPHLIGVTDGAININPDLSTKVSIIQNAIALFHHLGVKTPKVALLSAVETLNEQINGSLDWASICQMVVHKQIKNCVIDGPLSLDLALSEQARAKKEFYPSFDGFPDILVCPEIVSGNILFKGMELLSQGITAGIVMGLKVPMILNSRGASPQEYVLSCILAHLSQKEGIDE